MSGALLQGLTGQGLVAESASGNLSPLMPGVYLALPHLTWRPRWVSSGVTYTQPWKVAWPPAAALRLSMRSSPSAPSSSSSRLVMGWARGLGAVPAVQGGQCQMPCQQPALSWGDSAYSIHVLIGCEVVQGGQCQMPCQRPALSWAEWDSAFMCWPAVGLCQGGSARCRASSLPCHGGFSMQNSCAGRLGAQADVADPGLSSKLCRQT